MYKVRDLIVWTGKAAMPDSIGPTSGIPPLKEDRSRQRQRRSPYRATYDTEEDAAPAPPAPADPPDDDVVQMEWQSLPTSDALNADHWKQAPETDARKAVPTAWRIGRALGGRSRDPVQDPSVDVSVMGVPAHLVSESVQSAVTSMMQQMDELRDRLSGAEQREAFLLAQIERDGILGVLNQTTFLHTLDTALTQARDTKTAVFGALVYLENYDFLRRNQGLEAATSALVRLAAEFPPTDPPRTFTGTLGGASVAVIETRQFGPSAQEDHALFCADMQARLRTLYAQNPDLDVSIACLRAAPERENAAAFCRRLDAALREQAPLRSAAPDVSSPGPDGPL